MGAGSRSSWAKLAERARDVADGLAAIGIRHGDRVAILGETTTEWIVADLGIWRRRDDRPHLPVEPAAAIASSSSTTPGARFIFCDAEAQVAKIREVREQLPELEGIIRFTGAPRDALRAHARRARAGTAPAWRAGNPARHAARLAASRPEDAGLFIYTSGTTGNPKGVVLTHGNWVYEADAVAEIDIIRADDLVLLFLPMAHSFAKVIAGGLVELGATAAFVESLDKIVDNAGEVRPTVMPSVPRIFEKAYNARGLEGARPRPG